MAGIDQNLPSAVTFLRERGRVRRGGLGPTVQKRGFLRFFAA